MHGILKKQSLKIYMRSIKKVVFLTSLIVPDHDDYFLSWTRFWRLEKLLNQKNYYCSNIFSILSDPNEIELNELFIEI